MTYTVCPQKVRNGKHTVLPHEKHTKYVPTNAFEWRALARSIFVNREHTVLSSIFVNGEHTVLSHENIQGMLPTLTQQEKHTVLSHGKMTLTEYP